MIVKRIIFAGLFLIAGLAAASAQINLSFNLEKGKKYEYRMDVITSSQQNVGGQTSHRETEISFQYLIEIKDNTPEKITAQFSFTEIIYIVSSPNMKMRYNTKNPIENPTDVDKMLGKILNNLINQPFLVVIALDGSIKSVAGLDAICENAVNAIPDDGPMAAQLSAQMRSQFGDIPIKNSLEILLNFYPARVVELGDNWDIERTTVVGNMATTTQSKFTLKEFNEGMATIVAVFNTETVANPDAGMERKIAANSIATIVVDINTGLPVTSNYTTNIKGSGKVQGMDMQMVGTEKMRITGAVIDEL